MTEKLKHFFLFALKTSILEVRMLSNPFAFVILG